MKSSLALDANRRVAEYRKSVGAVQENVLLFKGFLGPALRERRGMATVGVRAARAAGVIVDAAGKLRCPPGTPNANQFTDLQMSNCMVAGAAAIKRGVRRGRREIAQSLEAAKRVLESKPVSKTAKVAALAALAALETLDYMHADGSGTLSGTVLIGLDIARAVGRDVADAALDGLERRGKITPEQRKDIGKLVDAVAEVGSSKYVAGLLAGRNRRRRRKTDDKSKPDADGDGERTDATYLTPEKHKELGRMKRGKELISAKFSRKAVSEEHAAKRERLLDTYVPDRQGKDAEDYVDSLLERMGIPTDDGPISKQLDLSLESYEKGIAQDIADLRNPELARNEDALQRRLNEAKVLEAVAEALKTESGRKEIRRKMAENFVDALVGVEMSVQANPALRGNFSVNLGLGPNALRGAAAWASQYSGLDKDKGKSVMAVTYSPRILILGRNAMSVTEGDVADLDGFVVEIAGEGTAGANLAALSVHEVGHIEHYMEIARSYGMDVGANAPTLIEQVKKHGPRLADSFLGMRLAMAYGIDPEKTWESPEVTKLMEVSYIPDRSAEEALEEALVLQVNSLTDYNEELKEEGTLREVIPYFSVPRSVDTRGEDLLFVLSNPKSIPDSLKRYVSGEARKKLTPEKMREILADVLDGQSVDEFIKEGIDAWATVLGFSPKLLPTRGVEISEFKEFFHQVSGYGNLNGFESVAEGRALQMFLTQYPSLSSTMSPEELSQMLERVVPRKPVTATPKMTPELRAHMIRVNRIRERLDNHPDLPRLTPEEDGPDF